MSATTVALRRLGYALSLVLVTDNVVAQPVDLPKPCASDPTYQYLESIQKDAYEANLASLQRLIRARTANDRVQREAEQSARRPNVNAVPPLAPPGFLSWLDAQIALVQTPTCYEDPGVFYMLTANIFAIDRARDELGEPSRQWPKYGSLPTRRVNAVTYYYDGTGERVIVFNNELFVFANVEAELAVATIPATALRDVQREPESSAATIMANFFTQPEWEDNALAAVRLFLHRGGRLPTIDQGYDGLVFPLVKGMDLFVTGHETAHVCRDHHPTFHREKSDSVRVAEWSWPQELTADELGIRLTAQALQDEAHEDVIAQALWLYALRGALLFMNALQMSDDAQYVLDHGVRPPKITEKQKAVLRKFARGQLSRAETQKRSGMTLSSYPPAWLRSERIRDLIAEYDKDDAASSEAKRNGRLADAILRDFNVFWSMAAVDMPKRFMREAK